MLYLCILVSGKTIRKYSIYSNCKVRKLTFHPGAVRALTEDITVEDDPLEAVARLSDTGPDRVKVKLLTLFHTDELLS